MSSLDATSSTGERKRVRIHKKMVWSDTFPDEIASFDQSYNFISRCIYVAFSQILAYRGLLPSTVVKERTIEGKVRAYVMNRSDSLGERIVQKFKGVNAAIYKGYLRELTLAVASTKEGRSRIIEVYTWRMHYNVDGEPQAELRQPDGTVMTALRFRGLEYLKKQTANFLLLIKLLCREMLTPLPTGTSAALCLTYTDRAPAGYQAPSFRPLLDYPVLPPDTQYVELARLQTKYHGASVVVRSVFIDDGYVMKIRLNEELRLHILDYSAFTPFDEESDEDNRAHQNAALQQTCAAAIGLLPPWTTQGVRHRHGGTKERGQPIHKSSGTLASDSHGTPSVRKTLGVTDIVRLTPEELPAKRGK